MDCKRVGLLLSLLGAEEIYQYFELGATKLVKAMIKFYSYMFLWYTCIFNE